MSMFDRDRDYNLPMKIYRGNDPEFEGKPLPKAVDMFEAMGSFEERIKYGSWRGFQAGATFALMDIAYHSKLRDTKSRLLRFAFFSVPGLTMGAGYVAALELSKKYAPDSPKLAYALASTVPAGIWATWRKRPSMFPKVVSLLGPAGVLYATMVENNLHPGATALNPNNPFGGLYKEETLFRRPTQTTFLKTDALRGTWAMPEDPGPTYAKFEQ